LLQLGVKQDVLVNECDEFVIYYVSRLGRLPNLIESRLRTPLHERSSHALLAQLSKMHPWPTFQWLGSIAIDDHGDSLSDERAGYAALFADALSCQEWNAG
jgi:hypothetical protein